MGLLEGGDGGVGAQDLHFGQVGLLEGGDENDVFELGEAVERVGEVLFEDGRPGHDDEGDVDDGEEERGLVEPAARLELVLADAHVEVDLGDGRLPLVVEALVLQDGVADLEDLVGDEGEHVDADLLLPYAVLEVVQVLHQQHQPRKDEGGQDQAQQAVGDYKSQSPPGEVGQLSNQRKVDGKAYLESDDEAEPEVEEHAHAEVVLLVAPALQLPGHRLLVLLLLGVLDIIVAINLFGPPVLLILNQVDHGAELLELNQEHDV
mmetsp:Transcript_17737/g.30033  ORF Transcript_17737/g.30033 Transcript_17737/m.30033 type:complete len:263 (-) Transcript_17737:357-1145(-)|eukprot:CAMPEP_0168609704 /NCGR_PEP_ID=MMETSP0449_2-20121227/1357_1 /TAXON_ID=1082188 /ORGANISM="Strombidium rassoulzadegani, Strain ras09" /LENGTH=262 /DNA_ID=CAMNT_0008649883 /DNA_START=370 /DNA_END=1158 /DNA_ORIENTATION=-